MWCGWTFLEAIFYSSVYRTGSYPHRIGPTVKLLAKIYHSHSFEMKKMSKEANLSFSFPFSKLLNVYGTESFSLVSERFHQYYRLNACPTFFFSENKQTRKLSMLFAIFFEFLLNQMMRNMQFWSYFFLECVRKLTKFTNQKFEMASMPLLTVMIYIQMMFSPSLKRIRRFFSRS